MKILLVGEYSRLHNSLKEGLKSLNHEVTIIASGDSFKEFPVDLSIASHLFTKNKILKFFNKVFYAIFRTDLQLLEKGIRFYLHLPKLKNYDVVQLINSDAIGTYPFLSRIFYKKLLKNNKSINLLVCGDETPIIDYLFKKELDYSILTPYFEDTSLKNQFQFPLKYRTKSYRKTFNWLSENCKNIIASDLDYKIPIEKMGYNVHFIPNPINTDTIKFKELKIENKVVVFLGINRGSSIKKGISYFEKSLSIIKEKYNLKVEIIITENIPYQEYIKLYDKAHILLDQVYAYDQGYNALEAMAKEKVVFTGAEQEFMNYYNLTERVCINAKPDVDCLVNELSFLIENPDEIIAIGKRARAFIEKEHNYIKIAQKYLEAWKN